MVFRILFAVENQVACGNQHEDSRQIQEQRFQAVYLAAIQKAYEHVQNRYHHRSDGREQFAQQFLERLFQREDRFDFQVARVEQAGGIGKVAVFAAHVPQVIDLVAQGNLPDGLRVVQGNADVVCQNLSARSECS